MYHAHPRRWKNGGDFKIYFRFRMVDFSAASTDSCLLHLLQEESARASFIVAEAYMYNEASARGSSAQDGREEEFPEVGRERARSRPHRGSRGLMHCFSIDLHVQDIPYSMDHFFILKIFIKEISIIVFVE